MSITPPGDDLPIPERIRNRRESLGIQGNELAERAGISASYLSLIENGVKLPSEEIAVRIAEALDDDAEIYRAWVHASPLADLDSHVSRLQRYASYRSDPEMRRRVRRGDTIDEDSAQPLAAGFRRASDRIRHWAASPPPPGPERSAPYLSAQRSLPDEEVEARAPTPAAVEVPLLPDGADPGDTPGESSEIIDTLRLDPKILPRNLSRPFAYRPGPASVARVRGSIRPGDLVVLTARPETIDPAGVYAVRQAGRIVLTRVLRHGTALLLLPPDDAARPESIDCEDEQDLVSRIAGVVVTTIRSWGKSARGGEPLPRPAPRGRSVRLEGDCLVRDCEWKDGYGWRPAQRPEDMDYLDAHPGMKIRFRLLREGRVRHLLEMSPAEWRQALGSYGEGRTWRTNGYIVAITSRRGGEYTEEFQRRWAGFVRKAGAGD